VESESGQAGEVGLHRVVMKLATHHLPQPPPLQRFRFMHASLVFAFQGTQLGAHPITARLAMQQEEAAT